MHVLFRTLGQAMGLQLVRAILPESIDTYLNDAIVDTVRKIVLSNSTMQFQDKVTIQNDTISPINAIRTLYKRNEIDLSFEDKLPQVLLIRYIENPAIVHLDDNENLCVDCNLPDYLHHEIVETAVQKYFSSVGSTSQSIQS